MMMNQDMREEYDDILRRLLDAIPGEVIGRFTTPELKLLLQGLGEVDARTILLPAVRDTLSQYRELPTDY